MRLGPEPAAEGLRSPKYLPSEQPPNFGEGQKRGNGEKCEAAKEKKTVVANLLIGRSCDFKA
jgi:hypothetical protein